MPPVTAPADPYAAVVGQPEVVGLLRRSAADPLPAYLFVGPRGSGRFAAALAFAGDVLASGVDDPDAAARHRRLATAGGHPDVPVFEREGPYIGADQARAIVKRSGLAPVEGSMQVLVLRDFELVQDAGPILLKAIEEPPPSTRFVIIAADVPVELVTIASRCVRVDFARIADQVVAEALVADGVDPDRAAAIALAVGGDVGRARLLADDPEFVARREAWVTAVDRLDGTGAAVAAVAADLLARIDVAAEPLKARHAAESAELDREEELYGGRPGARTRLTTRHKREMRRLRTDEMRLGLSALGSRLSDDLAARTRPAGTVVATLDAVTAGGQALVHNASERLLLQSILLAASRLD